MTLRNSESMRGQYFGTEKAVHFYGILGEKCVAFYAVI